MQVTEQVKKKFSITNTAKSHDPDKPIQFQVIIQFIKCFSYLILLTLYSIHKS